jgi:hypothetical protein
MGLLNKILKKDGGKAASGPASLPVTGFVPSDDADEAAERDATRRELVSLVLRESMRRHAVPSDWIECRIVPAVGARRKGSIHVQLVVRQGQASLLTYIPAFQSSFMAEVEKFEPRAWDWLLSISWQFEGITASTGGSLPEAGGWAAAPAPAPQPEPAPLRAPAAVAPVAAAEDPDALEEDLKALFAIRDAAIRGDDQPDFEPTRPGFSPSEGGPGR